MCSKLKNLKCRLW